MPIDRTPILPNQIWKEEEKIWVSTPKNEGTNDNNQELSAVSNVKTQDSQEPKKKYVCAAAKSGFWSNSEKDSG